MLIDSHCHLQHRRFAEEPALSPADLLRDAKLAGLSNLITIACERDEWQPALDLAAVEPMVFVGAGIHPQNAGEGGLVTHEELGALAAHPKVVGLGETGLDYFYDKAPRDAQKASFHAHLEVAAQTGVPVIIHTREAEDDTLAILRDHPKVRFVLHCFTSSAAMAHKAVGMGGFISFSGILTFKKSQDLRDLAKSLPRERVLVETDAPYLAPEPFRGRRCAPAMVADTARVLSEVWQLSPEDTAKLTAANTRRLFTRLPGA